MPTGYTAEIKNGITFKAFALNCAGAFGAHISMKEDSAETPIPDDFEIDTYHLDHIKQLRKELAEVKGLSFNQCEAKAQEQYYILEERRLRCIEDQSKLQESYQQMLQQVDNWNPPADYLGLQKFMKDQIEQSIEWDCGNTSSLEEHTVLATGVEWQKQTIQSLEDSIFHFQKQHDEEVESVTRRNKWIKELRNSLGA